jgi:biotin carboxyl carrier protein
LGQTVAAGTALGRIEPRLALTDRIGLNTQLATARADLNASAAAVAAAQTAYDRARALNADDKNISDKVLQEAAAKLAAEKAHEAGVRSTIEALNNGVASAGSASAEAVVAERGGEAVEILAQPGESVEQGATLVRLTRFDRLLARIDLPVGEQSTSMAGTARIVPAGFEEQPGVPAERVGVAPASDALAVGISMLYRLSRALPGIRPGMAVAAHFNLPGSTGEGVLIPRAAIVQQDGRLWAYVQTKDDRFSRRAVPLDYPTETGYIAAKGFSAGERIVVTGAQTLLSEEYKSQNEADSN